MAVKCKKINGKDIKSISQYFEALESALQGNNIFWFRGHADMNWSLCPSALRYNKEPLRQKALHSLLQ